jgi:hypothetical protein
MAGGKKSGALGSALKKIAMRHPEVEEAIACKGTALESAVYKTRKKSFLFVSEKQARMKLGASLAEAKKIGKQKPGSCEVGAMGWAAVSLGRDAPPAGVLEKWIGESYELAAGSKPAAGKTGVGKRKP